MPWRAVVRRCGQARMTDSKSGSVTRTPGRAPVFGVALLPASDLKPRGFKPFPSSDSHIAYAKD